MLCRDRTLEHGWLAIERGKIASIGDGVAPGTGVDVGGRWILPGMIDIHVHGGGGHSLMTADPEETIGAAAFHRRRGTTRLLASLVTAPVPELIRSLATLADLTDSGEIAGVHLEGPFLATARSGAQDPRSMLAPDPAVLEALLRSGRGAVKAVTFAPELDGALELIPTIEAHGALAAIGHTDATYDQTMRAIERGASLATHLFNAMRPIHHRDPGVAIACLRSKQVAVELIADGVHGHPVMINDAVRTSGAERAALITDAIAAAGMGDGSYRLGALAVTVTGNVARLTNDAGAIAGSTLTMDRALQYAVHTAEITVRDACTAAAATPARLLGIESHAGAIFKGADADLIVCEPDLTLVAVMRAGKWVTTPDSWGVQP